MDKFNLADVLGRYGIDDATAGRLKGKMQGDDLMNLVNYLTGPQGVHLSKASAILGKYGVKLGSSKPMENYLNAKYESVRNGRPLDETFGGVMTKVSEGYTYAVEVSEQSRDRVLDWLDENSVDYQATSPTNYRIECGDREGAYRTGRALSEILRKPTVRDSVEIEEKMSKNPDKRVKDAKAKMAEIKPRNPVVQAMAATGKSGSVHGDKDARRDAGRKAKYKPRYDEEIEEPITEGVMGMKPVNPLFRLRELAGLPELDEDDFEGIEIPEIGASDPAGPLGAGPVADEPADMDVDGMGDDPVADPMDDMDGGMDDMDGGMDGAMDGAMDAPVDPMGDEGVPGELGADPVEMPGDDMGMDVPDMDAPMDPTGAPMAPPVGAPMGMGASMAPQQSDAMAQIEDSLNSIQTGLADIRLSEYKSLIQKLQDLTNQAQMMGRDYLGESAMRRKK